MSRGIVVLGTGGHARSCLDVLSTTGVHVEGCVGDPPQGRLDAPYLGGDERLPSLRSDGVDTLFVAVGDNRTRARLSADARRLRFELVAVVSSSAVVSPSALIGAGAIVMHQAVVGPYSTVGEGAIVNTSASVDHDCGVGDFAHLAPGCHLAGDVRVGTGAFLGVGCSAIPGISVGAWATAGAGSTLVKDVEPDVTVVGTPARLVEMRP